MNIIPVGDTLLVQPIEEELPEGIIIPDRLKMQPTSGKILKSNIDFLPVGTYIDWRIDINCVWMDDVILVPLENVLCTFEYNDTD